MPSILLLADTSVHIDGRLVCWAAIGALSGVVFFFRGFQMLRYKRLVLNTPECKIRSAAMGLVEIEGLAKGPQTIPAGITGDPCFYYRAVAWRLEDTGRNRQWKRVADERLFLPFFLQDSTGRLLVNAQGADFDVHCNFKDECGSSFFSTRDVLPLSASLFLTRYGLAYSDRLRLEEYCVKPGFPLFIFGTLGRNDAPRPSAPAAHLPPQQPSHRSQLNVFGPFLLRFFAGIPGMNVTATGAPIPATPFEIVPAASAAPPSPSAQAGPAGPASSWSSVSIDEAGAGKLGAAIARHAASAQTAASLAASASPAAVADPPPAAPLPAPPAPALDADGFEVHPPVAIAKGSDGAPFTISSNSQKEVVSALAWKSTLCIWGGPVLTLVSLYVLLAMFGVL